MLRRFPAESLLIDCAGAVESPVPAAHSGACCGHTRLSSGAHCSPAQEGPGSGACQPSPFLQSACQLKPASHAFLNSRTQVPCQEPFQGAACPQESVNVMPIRDTVDAWRRIAEVAGHWSGHRPVTLKLARSAGTLESVMLSLHAGECGKRIGVSGRPGHHLRGAVPAAVWRPDREPGRCSQPRQRPFPVALPRGRPTRWAHPDLPSTCWPTWLYLWFLLGR